MKIIKSKDHKIYVVHIKILFVYKFKCLRSQLKDLTASQQWSNSKRILSCTSWIFSDDSWVVNCSSNDIMSIYVRCCCITNLFPGAPKLIEPTCHACLPYKAEKRSKMVAKYVIYKNSHLLRKWFGHLTLYMDATKW